MTRVHQRKEKSLFEIYEIYPKSMKIKRIFINNNVFSIDIGNTFFSIHAVTSLYSLPYMREARRQYIFISHMQKYT